MLTECKMVDSFRARNPEAKANYTYWSVRTKARGDNKGLRLCAPDPAPLHPSPLPVAMSLTSLVPTLIHPSRCPVAMSLTSLLVRPGAAGTTGSCRSLCCRRRAARPRAARRRCTTSSTSTSARRRGWSSAATTARSASPSPCPEPRIRSTVLVPRISRYSKECSLCPRYRASS